MYAPCRVFKLPISYFIIFLSFLTIGCLRNTTEELEYSTSSLPESLAALQNGQVALLVFDYDERLLLSGEVLNHEDAQPFIDIHKENLLLAFEPIFNLVDMTEIIQQHDSALTVDNPQLLRELLQEIEADGGILVTSAYGFKGEYNAAEEVGESLAEPLLDEDAPNLDEIPFLNEPTEELFHYHFVSNVSIIDQDGQVIWAFYGKVSALPSTSDYIKSLGTRFVGLNPTLKEMAGIMPVISEQYAQYNRWLIETDINGLSNRNYFTDYPDKSRILIYPALDETHEPYVSEDLSTLGIKESAPEQNNSFKSDNPPNIFKRLQNQAKASDWQHPSQWGAAWAALKLFCLYAVITSIFYAIYNRVDEESSLAKMVRIPVLVASIGQMYALWYFLRAIF
ncbi:MAG: hypothetical protein KDE48_10335 [Anaerolineales bacterium]|nr:hypothetical protein [Anaerolineales bacterium]